MKFLNLGCGSTFNKNWTNIDFFSNSKYVKEHNLLKGIPLANNTMEVVYHSHVLEHFSKKDGTIFIKECYRVLDKGGIIRIVVPNLEVIAKEYLHNLELAISGDLDAKQNYEWIKLELLDQMVRNESGGDMKSYLLQSKIPNERYVLNRIGHEGQIIINKTEFEKSSILKKIKFRNLLSLFKKMLSKCFSAYKIGNFRLGGEIHQWMHDRYSLTILLNEVGFKDIKICTAFESEIPNWNKYQFDSIDGKIRKPDSLFIEAKKI